MYYVGIDIGGTWIKGAIVDESFFELNHSWRYNQLRVEKVKSPLHAKANPEELIEALNKLMTLFNIKAENISGIGISTAGIVDYHGSKVSKAAEHLNVLKNDHWKALLEKQFQCHSVLINDADAAAIGIAEMGLLKGNKVAGIMPVGTGLGFSVWRNGRRWRPGKMLNLLGSIRTPDGSFNSIVSASALASEDAEGNLIHVLSHPSFEKARNNYIQNLANVINSAAIIYNLDEVYLCGGLAEAVSASKFPLEKKLNALLKDTPVELDKPVKATIVKEGNLLQLAGALFLIKGETVAKNQRYILKYDKIKTEAPHIKNSHLEKLPASELLDLLWKAEQEAGRHLKKSLPMIEQLIDKVAERLSKGGRLIYVGCGTSGRIAAMDAVEIPCTFGFPEDRILCLIPGGLADAAIEIESDFEEDASAIPEMLLFNLQPEDVVIGITASGFSYYVQSALSFAKDRAALSVLIQAHPHDIRFRFCNDVIPLYSGNEVVAGSTRMKAGTSTKKLLNFLSTSVMIKLGKVTGSYMTDLQCLNNKLVQRALNILKILYSLDEHDAYKMLKYNDMSLNKTIKCIQSGEYFDTKHSLSDDEVL